MELSDKEKEMIACRAYGSYAGNPQLRDILRTHNRKNRAAGDLVYLDFLRYAMDQKSTFDWEEYESLGRRVCVLHPVRQIVAETPEPEKVILCRTCNEPGHTARRCPEKPKRAVSLDGGVPRLTAGWDPSKGS